MNAWGLKVLELLREHKKRPAWLAKQTKISRSTIGTWLNSTDRIRPMPENVAKVAKAFGLETRDLAPYAGYPIAESNNDAHREARKAAPKVARRLARVEDELLDQLSAKDQDTLISMIEGMAEAFVTSRRSSPGSQ